MRITVFLLSLTVGLVVCGNYGGSGGQLKVGEKLKQALEFGESESKEVEKRTVTKTKTIREAGVTVTKRIREPSEVKTVTEYQTIHERVTKTFHVEPETRTVFETKTIVRDQETITIHDVETKTVYGEPETTTKTVTKRHTRTLTRTVTDCKKTTTKTRLTTTTRTRTTKLETTTTVASQLDASTTTRVLTSTETAVQTQAITNQLTTTSISISIETQTITQTQTQTTALIGTETISIATIETVIIDFVEIGVNIDVEANLNPTNSYVSTVYPTLSNCKDVCLNDTDCIFCFVYTNDQKDDNAENDETYCIIVLKSYAIFKGPAEINQYVQVKRINRMPQYFYSD